MAEPRLGGWPAVTAEEMREVDRIVVEELHIELVQMMENAGRCLAEFTIGGYRPSRVVVLAGAGGNGGGGLAAARHLANRGVEVVVAMARPAGQLTPAAAHQHDILTRMGIAIHTAAVGLIDEPSVGRVFLADISVPPGVYERIGLSAAAFGAAGVVELYDPGVLPPGLSEN